MAFQERLWGMFQYDFKRRLTLPQIERIRWHLFPEIRIGDRQTTLFSDFEEKGGGQAVPETIPDLVRVLDLEQETLARNLGSGHRVIHGVAGSGKTLILGYRCVHLAEMLRKPILVLVLSTSRWPHGFEPSSSSAVSKAGSMSTTSTNGAANNSGPIMWN